MSVNVDMVRLAARITVGTQDFTVAGFGTPKAAIIIVNGCVTNATPAADARVSYGITDGVRSWCAAALSRNGQTTTFTRRRTSQNVVSFMAADGTVDAVATASLTAVANGVQLNWTDAPAAAVFVTCIMFTGTDLSAAVNELITTTAVGLAQTVVVPTTPTFQPDLLFFLNVGATGSHNVSFFGGQIVAGFARRVGSALFPQTFLKWGSVTGAAPPAVTQDSNFVSNQYASGVTISQAIEVTAFNATGFDVTPRGSTNSYKYGYLALAFNGAAATWVGIDVPAVGVTGNVSTTTPGIKPQFVLQLISLSNAVNVILDESSGLTKGGAGTFGIAAFTATKVFSNSISDDDAATTSATESYASTDFTVRPDNTATVPIAFRGTIVSLDALGWTKNYTTNVGYTTIQWPTMVIGEFAPPATNLIPLFDNSYRQRRA